MSGPWEVGDEVCRAIRLSGEIIVSVVERVTPTGRAILPGGIQVAPGGKQIGTSGFDVILWRPLTDEIRAKYALQRTRARLRSVMGHVKPDTMDAAACDRMVAAIKAAMEAP